MALPKQRNCSAARPIEFIWLKKMDVSPLSHLPYAMAEQIGIEFALYLERIIGEEIAARDDFA